ncbi:MAG: hypothetical protein ACXAC7_13635 [Candidatus Hodarchaeales archaeon]|jgi:hypothetical protein
MKAIKTLRIMSLLFVTLLLMLQTTNSVYSQTKGWIEGDTYKWGSFSTTSYECEINGQKDSTKFRVEQILHETVHKVNETNTYVNVSTLYSGSTQNYYQYYSYNATDFGESISNLFDGSFYIENNTENFVMASFYSYSTLHSFVDPQWDIINTQIRELFNKSNVLGSARNYNSDDYYSYYYHYTWADIIGNATSYKLMGQDNWDDGIAKITNSTRSWSIEFDFTAMARQREWNTETQSYEFPTSYDLYKVKREISFNNDGVAESSIREDETMITKDDITCTTKLTTETKLGGLPASASDGVPGFELISVLLSIAALPILRRKIGNRG